VNRYLRTNQATWDVWARHHVTSGFYDVEGFKAGGRPGRAGLDALEMQLVGDVAGRSLLHLQCHFGLDTLSWARRGAAVTGVDFSGEAIAAARALTAEVGLPATFIQSDLYDLSPRTSTVNSMSFLRPSACSAGCPISTDGLRSSRISCGRAACSV
jgi:2-polyprenyl-3-methyl-5-hydroxy-6-metoxy-1,4-benzoquinol methylase